MHPVPPARCTHWRVTGCGKNTSGAAESFSCVCCTRGMLWTLAVACKWVALCPLRNEYLTGRHSLVHEPGVIKHFDFMTPTTLAYWLVGKVYVSTSLSTLPEPQFRLPGHSCLVMKLCYMACANAIIEQEIHEDCACCSPVQAPMLNPTPFPLQVKKTYRAVVAGKLTGRGQIVLPLDGKSALTEWQALESTRSLRYGHVTTVKLHPLTGWRWHGYYFSTCLQIVFESADVLLFPIFDFIAATRFGGCSREGFVALSLPSR